jgi:hypothetical protein
MGISEEIQEMQKEGRSESEIRAALIEDGVSQQRVEEMLSEIRIKAAVNDNNSVPNQQTAPQLTHSTQEMAAAQESYDRGDFTPSMFNTQEEAQQQAPLPQQYDQQYQDPNQQYVPQYQDPYQNQYQTGLSSDTISEISEQVFTEKIASLRKEVEKISDLKTTVSAKIEYLDDRLKRIEKIIDRLQLSVLQKVGEYVTNVEDLKKEVVETQKSFKALHSAKK